MGKLIAVTLSKPAREWREEYIGYVERDKVTAVTGGHEFPQGWPYTVIHLLGGEVLESNLLPERVAWLLDEKKPRG